MKIVRESRHAISIYLTVETRQMIDSEAHFHMWIIYSSLIGEQKIHPRTVRFWPEFRKISVIFMSKRDCARFLAGRRHSDVS